MGTTNIPVSDTVADYLYERKDTRGKTYDDVLREELGLEEAA